MNLRYTLTTCILTCLPLWWACQDNVADIMDETDVSKSSMQLSGLDGYLCLTDSLEGVKSVEVLDGAFLTALNNGRLYYEQNDGASRRTATIRVTFNNCRDSVITLSQRPVTRAEIATYQQFYRNFGIGYSYNAINGDYCNLKDFRCQVFNRAVLELIPQKELVGTLLNVNKHYQITSKSSVYTSVVDYVQNTNFSASGNAKIQFLYKGNAATFCHVFEDGVTDSYILHDEISNTVAEYGVDYESLMGYIEDYPSVLTSSFRAALAKITSEDKSIDDFINTYGTHVVIYAQLGAKMSVDVQVETKKFTTIEADSSLSTQVLATMFNSAKTTSEFNKNYQILKDCTCKFSVTGGDASPFDKLITINTFDKSSYGKDVRDAWLNSIQYDDNDLSTSNVSLVDMRVIPIWNFIADEDLADRVEARVTGNFNLIAETLGNTNFINTSFVAHPESVTCRIGSAWQTYKNPETVDIISGNRHVATICKEYIPDISNTEKVFVVYPIYEGRIKMTDGICIYNKKVYAVDWRITQFRVTELEDAPSDTIYMNCGVLSTTRYDQLEYQASHPILGCERPGGIAIDGSLSGSVEPVFKHFGHFYLDNKTKYTNLPGWSYKTTNASEADTYPSFFPSGTYMNRMVRDDSYTYILNTTEIGYE